MKKVIFNFRKKIISSSLLFAIGLCATSSNAQPLTNGQTFTTAGTYSGYTVPIGITSLTIEAWGGGGGGSRKTGTVSSTSVAAAYSAGGGGGSYTLTVLSGLTPGSAVTVVVGSGGAATTSNPGSPGVTANGNPGGYSAVITTVNKAQASGGQGGQNGGIATGGGGGTLSGATAPGTTHVGGNSNNNATANNSSAGGGGGTLNDGGTPAQGSNTGGAGGSVGGGAGGNGGKTTNPGNPGTAAGGGGAGSRYNSTSSDYCYGGAGADGMVIITFTPQQVGPFWLNQSCTTGSGNYLDGGTIIPTRTVQTSSVAATPGNYGYVFWTFAASKDSTYYFDLCASVGTTQSRLRLHNARITNPGNNYCMDALNTPTLEMENIPNGCSGTGVGLSKIIWTCRKSGTYYLESAGDQLTYWGLASNQTAVLSYKTLPSSSSVCTDVFYDKGIDGTNGSSYNYNNSENWIYTYYPLDTVTGAIYAQISSFSSSPGDVLCVYDGNSVSANQIGCIGGPSVVGAWSSTASDGSLTFEFTSDSSGITGGWEIGISCVQNVGISNPGLKNKLSIFPNPVKDKLWVMGYELWVNEINIYNALGEKIFSQSTSHNPQPTSIDVSALLPGIYFIQMENGWGRFVKE